MYNDFLENIFYKKKLVPLSFLNGTNFYEFYSVLLIRTPCKEALDMVMLPAQPIILYKASWLTAIRSPPMTFISLSLCGRRYK